MIPGPLMLDVEGLELTDRERELLRHPMTGGVILFARNVASQQQVAALTTEIRQLRPELLLAVDQEGGRVQRFRDGYTRFPAMAKLGALLEKSPSKGEALLRDSGWLLAAEVIASGVDFSFAPVLDVDDCNCDVIADRSFSPDPVLATLAARFFIQGMHEAGMAVTGKHFPGHGGVTADSHLETPRDDRTLDQLRARDIKPFASLADELDAVMPAHILFPRVDSNCVGFSPYWLQSILRGELGFRGVIFSDDLSMKGADIAGSYPAKAEAALRAGCDMVLVCNNRQGAIEVLEYLENTHQIPSSRLPAMKARKHWDWEQLAGNDRRNSVRERLALLG